MQNRYEYDILNYWNDQDDLYVNYIVKDNETGRKANAVDYYNTSDLSVDYNIATPHQIENSLIELINKNNGREFDLPKVSELSPLLRLIYNDVLNSDSNMCYIDYHEWIELENVLDYTEDDIELLKKEIIKYKLEDYISIDDGEYKILGYGMLQTCFNDDREKEVEYER